MMRPRMRRGRQLRAGAIALVVLLASACDAFIGTESRLERAGAAMAAGDYVAAMAETKIALEKDPDRADARLLLAEVMLRIGDAAAARFEFDRAMQGGADPAEHRELHYRILAGAGRHAELLEEIVGDKALDSVARLRLQAQAQNASGLHAEALETIRLARGEQSGDDAAAFIEAQALWSAGQQQAAIAALDQLLERQPDQARWWLYRGRYALSQGQAEPALNAFQKARQSRQATLDFREQLAAIAGLVEANLAAGDMAGVEQALAQLDQRAPSSFGTLLLRGRVALAQRDYNAATAYLQRSLVAEPDAPFARLLLGASLLQQGALEQADAELARLVAEQPENSDARNLLARVYLARNDVEGARRVLAAAPAGTAANAGTNWMLGSLLLRTGQSAEAIGLLEASAAADPDNTELQLDLVRAYLATGRAEKAARQLASLPDEQGGYERSHLTILAATRGREPAEAERRVTAFAAERPGDVGMQVAAGTYYLAIGDNESAAASFERVVAEEPDNAEARMGMAAIAMRNGDLAAAESQLKQALASSAGDERVLLGLADVAQARRDRAAARQWLERAIGTHPSAVESRLRLADMSFAEKDATSAQSLLEQALAVATDPPSVHYRVGAMYVRQASYDRALTHFSEAATRGVPGAAMDAVRTLIALGREDEARSRLEQENRAEPAAPMPVAMLVSLDAADRRMDRALQRIAAFEKAGGSPADAAEIRGDLQAVAGKHAEAADAYARAGSIRPNEMLAMKEYYARVAARSTSPEAVLQRWLDRNPRSIGTRYLLGEHYHKAGQRAAAVAEYERLLQRGPHAFALNNLALLYQEAGDGRTTATAKRAYEMAPGNPAIADTYGWILVQRGDAAAGMRVLEAATKAAPSQSDIQYHYAAAQAVSGHKNEAIANLRVLLETSPQFDSRREAESLLASLSGG